MIHYQRSRTTFNFKKGDRVRLGCERTPAWHKRDTFSTAATKITCPDCITYLIKKRIIELQQAAERCGLSFEKIMDQIDTSTSRAEKMG